MKDTLIEDVYSVDVKDDLPCEFAVSASISMTLHDWLEANNMSPAELAKTLKVTSPQVYRFLRGQRLFGKETAWKVYQLTKKKVSLEHLLYGES